MQKKKGLALVLSFALVICLGVAGVLAYLTDTTDEVKNTFTVGNIEIALDESQVSYADGNWTLNTEERVSANDYEHVYPGAVLPKDPVVTVIEDSEPCWLFVTVTPAEQELLSYGIAEGWTKLEDGVYYRSVDRTTALAGAKYPVLAGNKVTVSEDATSASQFTDLQFKAYAIQSEGFATADAAWAELSK